MSKDLVRYKNKLRKYKQAAISSHEKSIEKLISHSRTKIIDHEQYRECFDYVSGRFPNVNINEAKLYLCDGNYFIKMGYKGAGGFYSRISKVIMIPDKIIINKAKQSSIFKRFSVSNIDKDIVVVHELLHYVSGKVCDTWKTTQIEEEFAYGKSIDYVRSKGWSDEDIITKYFMPYLLSATIANGSWASDKLEKESVMNEIEAAARNLGKEMIRLADKKESSNISSKFISPTKVINLDLD